MKVIIPCCELTSGTPRWINTINFKNSMIVYTILHTDCNINDIVVVVYKWDQYRYQIRENLQKYFGVEITVVELDKKCNSQPETIKETILMLKLKGDFFIKDVDCCFDFSVKKENYNYICVSSLMNFTEVNPQNKCYTKIDHENNIIDIKENIIISDLFISGGYYFAGATRFLKLLKKLNRDKRSWEDNLKLSDIIGIDLLDNEQWMVEKINNYEDYGS